MSKTATSAMGALAALALVVVAITAFRYDYVNRGPDALRIDRITGRTAVLRHATTGAVEWVTLKTQDDVVHAQELRAARCKTVEIPDAERLRISVAPSARSAKGATYFPVTNGSAWVVEELRGRTDAGQTLAVRLVEDVDRTDPDNVYVPAFARVAAGSRAEFGPSQGSADPGVGTLLVVERAFGAPSGCPIL